MKKVTNSILGVRVQGFSRRVLRGLWPLVLMLFSVSVNAQTYTFSPLVERGTDWQSMAFAPNGDLFFIGWEAGLEKSSYPDYGDAETLIPMQGYLSFFSSGDGVLSVVDVNGIGMAVTTGKVISLVAVAGETSDGREIYRSGFVQSDQDGGNFERIPLTCDIVNDFDTLGCARGMVLTTLDGVETLIFAVYGIPGILRAPAAGGAVTFLREFTNENDQAWTIALMERGDAKHLVYGFSDGAEHRHDLYALDLGNIASGPTLLASREDLLPHFDDPDELIDHQHGSPSFAAIVYEPVGGLLYFGAHVWHTDVPETLFSIRPDGSQLGTVFDGNTLVEMLEDIRTPQIGPWFGFGALAVSPRVITDNRKSLFLGDYWSGLKMIRMDIEDDMASLTELIEWMPIGAFSAEGHKTSFLANLKAVQNAIDAGDTADAAAILNALLKRVDGCGTGPDRNDWVTDCTAQVEIRNLLYNLLEGL
jgi:hypothetical protein